MKRTRFYVFPFANQVFFVLGVLGVLAVSAHLVESFLLKVPALLFWLFQLYFFGWAHPSLEGGLIMGFLVAVALRMRRHILKKISLAVSLCVFLISLDSYSVGWTYLVLH